MAAWRERLVETLGEAPFGGDAIVDRAEADGLQILLVEGELRVLIAEGEPFPTVRALLGSPTERRYVTVDMGAVPHVANGADVMAPGIVAADPAIGEGNLVWVRDEKNRVPLAVGRALLAGPDMVSATRGKAVETLHYVGDWIWQLGEE